MTTDNDHGTGIETERETTRRQVLPDVSERAEFAGNSILGLMYINTPAMAVLFYTVHFAPPGFGWLGFGVGCILVAATWVIVLATPDHLSVTDYARLLYQHYTTQAVYIHD